MNFQKQTLKRRTLQIGTALLSLMVAGSVPPARITISKVASSVTDVRS